MKRLFVIGMALAFTLGIAGLGLAADNGIATKKHDDVKACANVNCCGNLKKAAPETKPEEGLSPERMSHDGG